MTADLLREAATLMRQRANAASQGTWQRTSEANIGGYPSVITRNGAGVYGVVDEWHVESPDAEHIASWHPLVALAVADVLEHEAAVEEQYGAPASTLAVAVARVYLGRDT
jgi:hypothetical protein